MKLSELSVRQKFGIAAAATLVGAVAVFGIVATAGGSDTDPGPDYDIQTIVDVSDNSTLREIDLAEYGIGKLSDGLYKVAYPTEDLTCALIKTRQDASRWAHGYSSLSCDGDIEEVALGSAPTIEPIFEEVFGAIENKVIMYFNIQSDGTPFEPYEPYEPHLEQYVDCVLTLDQGETSEWPHGHLRADCTFGQLTLTLSS